MVRSELNAVDRAKNLQAMATLMGMKIPDEAAIEAGTMIRGITPQYFDPSAVSWNAPVRTDAQAGESSFWIHAKRLPNPLPTQWRVITEIDDKVQIALVGEQSLLVPATREFPVKTAGMLPDGFDPSTLYASRSHPKGLQMSLFAASDALAYSGLDWPVLQQLVGADQVSVYVGSAMGQLDYDGGGGLLSARARGARVTSKHCPLSLADMPADFINAYVLGHMGRTGATLGACASFLYNLRTGIEDIQSGRAQIAFVGGADAPVVPEVMDGYAAMGALATAESMAAIDGVDPDQLDLRSICRPFGENCGFTIGESAQIIMLMSDELALRCGAQVLGAAPLVEVCADGFKKSISGPGAGNYLTVAKILASARGLLGEESIRHRGMVQAHGTSTPQNRVTEGMILSRVAKAFGVEQWPVAAIKTYLGHSLGAASADQLVATLGVWQHSIIPGIKHTKSVAADVETEGLEFVLDHKSIDSAALDFAVLNSKGFGGNNASALVLSPAHAETFMRRKVTKDAWLDYQGRREQVKAQGQAYDDAMSKALQPTRYLFDNDVIGDVRVHVSQSTVAIDGFGCFPLTPSLNDYICD
jgi:acetoacetyl-[acyl-carrier protein] synthase